MRDNRGFWRTGQGIAVFEVFCRYCRRVAHVNDQSVRGGTLGSPCLRYVDEVRCCGNYRSASQGQNPMLLRVCRAFLHRNQENVGVCVCLCANSCVRSRVCEAVWVKPCPPYLWHALFMIDVSRNGLEEASSARPTRGKCSAKCVHH